MKAVIMAGGQGTRLKPLTCTVPKPMINVLGKPVIDYTLDLLEENGFDEVYITLKYLSDIIRNHVYSQNRQIRLHFVTESEFLGTAGGVKNALKQSDEPFLVISGDAVCDYRLGRVMKYHIANSCCATVVTAKVGDPSEYGVVCSEKDGRVRGFIEKPSFTQAVSNNANTGIYVLNPEILDMIPEKKQTDFSKDIFPKMLESGMRLFEYPAEGYWCDIGDFASYRQCQRDMLDGKANIRVPSTYCNIKADSDSNIKINPPCYIGKNVTLGKNVTIGPYSVIGDGCKIDDNTKIYDSVVGRECYIGKTVKINSAVVGSNCTMLKNVSVFENCVIGDRVRIDSDCVLSSDVRVWPNKMVVGGATVSENIKYTVSRKNLFDESGISGTGGVDVTAEKCSLIGSAIGSTAYGKKVGVACDGHPLSRAMLMCLAGGMLSAGSRVWSFDDCLIPQLYFYTAYCSLNCGVYVSSKNEKVKIEIFAPGGLSIPATVRREIERRITDRSFSVCDGRSCKVMADMSGVGLMYQRRLLEQCGGLEGIYARIKCDNEKISMLLNDAFHRLGGKNGEDTVINVTSDGRGIMAYDRGGEVFGSDTVLAICCMHEIMSGRDIAVPFDAPSVIDSVAEKYSRKVLRYLSGPSGRENESAAEIAKDQLWARDALFLTLKLLGAIAETGMSLTELKNMLPQYNAVTKTESFNIPFYELYSIFDDYASAFRSDGEGIEIRRDGARAIILPRPGSNSLRIISEAVSAETAESLCDGIIDRLRECDQTP